MIDSHALLRHLTGRRQALADLHALCTEKQRVVLSGLGGIGKTTLALKYLKDHEEEYDLTHFMPAGDKVLMTAGLLSLANKLGIPKGKDNERLERLKTHLNQTPAKVLLVFDGVDHPDSFEYLQTLLPEKGKCLLITSRLPSYAKKIGFTPLDLKPFTSDEAIDFFIEATLDTNREQAALLAETLGYLPLALTHAAAYIRETPGLNFEEYNKLFKESGVELFEEEDLEGILSHEEKTILTTWDMSLKTIRECHKSPLSMDVMHFFSSLAHAPIPINIVAEWFKTFVNSSQRKFNTATRLLQSYSLITSSPGFYNMHMLVQQVTRYKTSQKLYQKHLKEALQVFHSLVEDCDPERPEVREFLAPFIPHFEGICSPLEKESFPNEEGPLVRFLLNKMWGFYQYGGKYQEALSYAQREQKVTEGQYGNPSTEWATSLNNMGGALKSLGKHEEALVYKKEALELFRELLGSKHPDVALSLNNVGMTLKALGKHEEALVYLKEALELFRELLGSKHPHVAMSLNNVGLTLQDLGKHEEALVYLKEALELFRELLDSKHPHVATSLNNVGSALQALGKHEEALVYQKEALELRRELLGSKHPHVALSLNNVGMTLRALGKHDEALVYHEEALELFRELLGSKHPHVALSLNNVGMTLQDLGKHEEAVKHLRKAVEMSEATLGPYHPNICTFYRNLAQCLQALKRDKEAKVYQQKAIMGRLSTQLPGNPISGAQLRQALQEGMDQFFRNWTQPEDSPDMGSSAAASSSQTSEVGAGSMLSQTASLASSSSQPPEVPMRQALQPAMTGFFVVPTSPVGGLSAIASSSSSSQTDLTTKLDEIISEIEAFERDPFRATKEKREVLIQKIMELASSGLDPRVLHALCERVLVLSENSSGASSSSGV